MIFAAGIGSRLKPWTDTHPKALVPVGGRPMLEQVIRNIERISSVTRIVVNVHHFAPQIVEFLSHFNSRCEIVVSDESDLLLDTGGGLSRAASLLEAGPVIVHNADIFTDLDLNRLVEAHLTTGADVTMTVSTRQSSRQLAFDDDMRLRGWINHSTGTTIPPNLSTEGVDKLHLRSFNGIHVISPKVLSLLSKQEPNRAFPVIPFYLDSIDTLDIRGWQPTEDYRWVDVGKPDTLARAQALFCKD